jgi:FkbM family methyltransferase
MSASRPLAARATACPFALANEKRRSSRSLMGIASWLEGAIQTNRRARLARAPGPVGDWYRENGPEIIWRDLPIGSDHIALDVGGYRGDWTSELLCRYGSRSWVFEPVPEQAQAIRSKFRSNSRVIVTEAALGPTSGEAEIAVADDASSMHLPGSRRIKVPVMSVAEVFSTPAAASVGCMKINIEGGEYDLLERMSELDLLGRVATLHIQFHRLDGSSVQRREAIRASLARSHGLVLDYPFVWERWDRKGA